MINRFLWFLLFAAFEAVLVLVQIPLRKKPHKILNLVLFIVKLVLILLLALIVAGFNWWLSWHGTYPVCALYIAVCGDAAADLISGITWKIREKKLSDSFLKRGGFVAVLSVVLGIAYLCYGTENMQHVRCHKLTYTSEKIKSEKTFAFLADLHVGSSQKFSTLEKTVAKIQQAKPDFIVLGGDVVDEFTEKDEMEKTFQLFGKTGIPVYYIYGNHDRQESSEYIPDFKFTNKELEDTIVQNGITILCDDYLKLYDDLVIFGREDASAGEKRGKIEDLPNPYTNGEYLLCIDHQPYNYDDIVKTKADLQMSGHSHAGQLFPLKTFYALIGLKDYGKYQMGDTSLYVSAGESGWSVPFRTEVHCYYEMVTLKAK